MSKNNKLTPINTNSKQNKLFSFITFLCDRGGVGHIRTILPNIVIGSGIYKGMHFNPTYFMNFLIDPNFLRTQRFIKFQRSATIHQLQFIEHLWNKTKPQINIPMFYEIDDILFDIPKSNYASQYYKQNENNIKKIMAKMDGTTVSTPFLQDYYKQFNSNISVVRNRLAKFMGGEIKECEIKERDKLRVVYPGSQNHFPVVKGTEGYGDIGKTLLDYIHLTKKDKIDWIFVGGAPLELTNDEDITYYNWIEYLDYPRFMKNLDVDIAIAPLEINDFNRGKSDLKTLEYCICGIPGIYTNIEPYKNNELTADTESDMIDLIEGLRDNPDKRYEVGKKDTDKIRDGLFLEDNRKKGINSHLKLLDKKLM